ncbi:MAG TPA: polyhydroxyalkanoate depolymerase [Burkholderiaceae bacterium]|nr:polyhydroxyalkanoate depolymerase [Burkholderiaceae bacterium]
MLYEAYETHNRLLWPMRTFARSALDLMAQPVPPLSAARLAYPDADAQRRMSAAFELISRARLTHRRPPFGIDAVETAGHAVQVTEEIVASTPFADLLRFRKDIDLVQARVLLVAPMSGHFATLMRETVRTLLPEHDVFVTDWRNARDVAVYEGRFGFDEYVAHLIHFLDSIGPGAHVIAVCQPCVAALVAAAVMAQGGHPARPRSLTLMAGPIDCRINPTRVNELAVAHPIDWFESRLIATVPWRYRGAWRQVYPGFLQLTAFMSMNLERHVKAFVDLYNALVAGEYEKAEGTRTFYREYFAVADLPAEFYLETVRFVFQECALARGALKWQGMQVEPAAIRGTALLTVEGERDDICAIGQTMAAHDICTGIRPYLKQHHMQPGVGHYGVFSGRRWQQEIYPIVRDMIYQTDARVTGNAVAPRAVQ